MDVAQFAILSTVILVLLGLAGFAFLKYVIRPTEGVSEED
jgi:uncharacterized membrane protein YuzA (DUF378 family)